MTEFEYALELEDRLINILGTEELLQSLIRALGLDELIDNYLYIARMHDIDIDDIIKQL